MQANSEDAEMNSAFQADDIDVSHTPISSKSKQTVTQIRAELIDLQYQGKISSKAKVDELRHILMLHRRSITADISGKLDAVYSTPRKSMENFVGVNPIISSHKLDSSYPAEIITAYRILTDESMVIAGHQDELQTMLRSLGLHSVAQMADLITISDYIDAIATHFSPIGRTIFLRAVAEYNASLNSNSRVRSSPILSTTSPTKSPISSTVKSQKIKNMEIKLATVMAQVGKINNSQSIKHESVVPIVSTLKVDSEMLKKNEAAIAAVEAECAAFQASLLAPVASPPLPAHPLMAESEAVLSAVTAKLAALKASNPSTPAPSTARMLLEEKMHKASLPLPVSHTSGIDDDDDVHTVLSDDDGDNSEDDESDVDDSGKRRSKNKSAIRSKSSALLRQRSVQEIKEIKAFWGHSSDATYEHILAAVESPLGIRVIDVVGGVSSGKLKQSPRSSGKEKILQATEVYGPPSHIQPFKGGLARRYTQSQVIFPRSYAECILYLDNQVSLLMDPRFVDLQDKDGWLTAYHELRIEFLAYSSKLLGPTPDIPQSGYIQKSAGMCLFLFSRCQAAHSARLPALLNDDFKADWDRQVRTMASAVLGRDLKLTYWNAILTIRGLACSNNVCGALGMTQEICGICFRGTKAPEPSAMFLANKVAARALFKSTNPNFPSEAAELAAFNKSNKDAFVWKQTSQSLPTTRTEALVYIFQHQQKIGLPFCLA
jgi:hypothetical protein